MKTQISPSVMEQLAQQANEQGLSVDDLIRRLLNHQPQSGFEIFEHITDAFFALDKKMCLIYVNHEAETLLHGLRFMRIHLKTGYLSIFEM